MTVTMIKERWTSQVNELILGTGDHVVKVGGESTLPFLHFEGNMPHRPVVALEILDQEPTDWPEMLQTAYTGVMNDPVAWAQKCVEYGADLLCLHLVSAHPDNGNATPEDCAKTAKAVSEAVNVPLIVIGCGVEEKDAEIMPAVGEALNGKAALLGYATPNNYKTIAATCMVNGHSIIAASPLDINLAKQLNILITEMGLSADRIAIDSLVGALGYGIEYGYSIMERSRIGALTGDKMLAMPVICFVGQEAWKTKEAKTSTAQAAEWGEQSHRAILWEVLTATTFAQAGANIFVLRHPESVQQFLKHIQKMMETNAES